MKLVVPSPEQVSGLPNDLRCDVCEKRLNKDKYVPDFALFGGRTPRCFSCCFGFVRRIHDEWNRKLNQ